MRKFTFKKLLFTTCILALTGNALAQSNSTQERSPFLPSKPSAGNATKALWDIQFNFNLTDSAAGDVGMAAAIYFNNEFWVSRWASDTLYRFDMNGSMISEFTIAGLSGVRSLTTDGTYLYAGNNSTTVYRIDPGTATLSAPNITVPAAARFCTYDPMLDSGNGGFWIGNFSTDILGVNMSGTTVSTIPAATHGLTGMYGAAIDNFTTGGPYLWIFDQGGASATQLVQLGLPSGSQTGLIHDVMSDVGLAQGLSSGLSGGCFISDQIVSGQVTIGGIIQGTPDNILFGYELTAPALDAGISSIRTVQGYKQIPLAQVSADNVTIGVQNNSGVVLDSMIVNIELYSPTNAVVYTEQQIFTNVAALSTQQVNSQAFTPAAGIGAYRVKATVSTTTSQQDMTPANDTLSYDFMITDSVFARDDNVPDGGTGYVISASDWGYAASLYNLNVADTLVGIWIQLATPTDMDTTYGIVVSTNSGVPTGMPLQQTPVQIIQGAQNTYYMPFTSEVPLAAGMYAFGCYEGVNTGINLAQSANVYTPGTNFFYTGTSAAWTQSSISTARFIRPVFKHTQGSAGLNNLANLDFKTYPNPSEGLVTIQAGNCDQFTYVLTDMNGRTLETKTINDDHCQIDLTNLTQGVYVLTLTSGQNLGGQQLIIKK